MKRQARSTIAPLLRISVPLRSLFKLAIATLERKRELGNAAQTRLSGAAASLSHVASHVVGQLGHSPNCFVCYPGNAVQSLVFPVSMLFSWACNPQ